METVLNACLSLEKDADGKHSISFNFENVEAKKLKDAVCPLCGGDIVKTLFGYGCSNYQKEDPEHSCRFSINSKIAGVKLSDKIIKQLLAQKKTDVIQGFISKSGSKFDASLKLNEKGQAVFDFPDKPALAETNLACPRCKAHKLKKGQWYYECDCGFKVGHTIAQVSIAEEVIQELFINGKTKEKVTGFISKAGKQFDAYLKYTDEKIQFDFENQNQSESATESPAQRTLPWVDTEQASDEYWESLMAGVAEI